MKIEEAGPSKRTNEETEKEAKKYAKNGSRIRKWITVQIPSVIQKLQEVTVVKIQGTEKNRKEENLSML